MVVDADAAEGVAARNGDGVLEETLAEEWGEGNGGRDEYRDE